MKRDAEGVTVELLAYPQSAISLYFTQSSLLEDL